MPVLDQSVARHVGLDLSKILTPLLISSTIFFYDTWNAWSRSAVHSNLLPGFRKDLNGSMVSATLKAWDIWFTSPNHDLTSVRFVGVGSLI